LAAGEQGKFREMQDLIFTSKGKIDQARLIDFARQLKLDEVKFKAALEKEISQFEQDRAGDVKGTPVLFVNGQKLDGVPDLAMLSERVEKERRRATE
jgi:protein-disulfide isomerase